jgi:hypothetical protein
VFGRYSGYSRGGISAGFAKTWHYGTFRNLAIYFTLLLAGITLHPILLILPLLFHLARVHSYLNRVPWLKKIGVLGHLLNYGLTSIIQIVIDLATFHGVWKWMVKDKFVIHSSNSKVKSFLDEAE